MAKHPTLTDLIVCRLADDLTGPMRAAILWLPADGSFRPEDGSVRFASLSALAARRVIPGVKAALAENTGAHMRDGAWLPYWLPYEWRATALGLEVRNLIEAVSPKDGAA